MPDPKKPEAPGTEIVDPEAERAKVLKTLTHPGETAEKSLEEAFEPREPVRIEMEPGDVLVSVKNGLDAFYVSLQHVKMAFKNNADAIKRAATQLFDPQAVKAGTSPIAMHSFDKKILNALLSGQIADLPSDERELAEQLQVAIELQGYSLEQIKKGIDEGTINRLLFVKPVEDAVKQAAKAVSVIHAILIEKSPTPEEEAEWRPRLEGWNWVIGFMEEAKKLPQFADQLEIISKFLAEQVAPLKAGAERHLKEGQRVKGVITEAGIRVESEVAVEERVAIGPTGVRQAYSYLKSLTAYTALLDLFIDTLLKVKIIRDETDELIENLYNALLEVASTSVPTETA